MLRVANVSVKSVTTPIFLAATGSAVPFHTYHVHNVPMTMSCSKMQWCIIPTIGGIDSSPTQYQQVNNLCMAFLARPMQGAESVVIPDDKVKTRFNFLQDTTNNSMKQFALRS
jgi:hypothetical protein